MSNRSSTLSALVAVVAAGGLLTFILRSALGGPPTVPTKADIAGAAKEVPAKGKDERVPLPELRGVAGNGIIEPADRETRVAGQAPGRTAALDGGDVDAVVLQVHLGQPLHQGGRWLVGRADAEGGLAEGGGEAPARRIRARCFRDFEADICDPHVAPKRLLHSRRLRRERVIAQRLADPLAHVHAKIDLIAGGADHRDPILLQPVEERVLDQLEPRRGAPGRIEVRADLEIEAERIGRGGMRGRGGRGGDAHAQVTLSDPTVDFVTIAPLVPVTGVIVNVTIPVVVFASPVIVHCVEPSAPV